MNAEQNERNNVRSLPLSPYMLEEKLLGDMRRVVLAAYDKGFKAGEAVARKAIKKAADLALGVGLLIGTGFGMILAVAVVGWVS